MSKLRAGLLSSTAAMLLCMQPVAADADLTLADRIPLYEQAIDQWQQKHERARRRREALAKQLMSIDEELARSHSETLLLQREHSELSATGELENTSEANFQSQRRAVETRIQQHVRQLEAIRPVTWIDFFTDAASTKKRSRLRARARYGLHLAHASRLAIERQEDMARTRMDDLERLRERQLGQLQDNARQRNARQKLQSGLEIELGAVTAEVGASQQRLATLRHRLEQIVRSTDPTLLQFGSNKGALPDPVSGALRYAYSEPKVGGMLQWNGIVVDAPLGANFFAVFDGVVEFADRLQGFGNMAIINHGNGYMSLYGMADYLMVEAGQNVLGGQPIGTVGEFVAANSSGLYFEIRHNAATLDPQEWLSMRQISTNPQASTGKIDAK